MSKQIPLPNTDTPIEEKPVTCLGETFPSDTARRETFRARLREKLKDKTFREQPGFPKATDDAIVSMSDPPWYTACPNPWAADFVKHYGAPFESDDGYTRDPFAVDVIEKKTGLLYQAHGYHTKVPYLAIVPFILHYTKPGDVILDGFCGSGMAGVAAQWCGTTDAKLRGSIEKSFKEHGVDPPVWGARRAVLNDLSPAATYIAANYNAPFDVEAFKKAANKILDEIDADEKLGKMYRTRHTNGQLGHIEYTVWSEVFTCNACSGEVVFTEEALDEDTQRVKETFPCPHCTVALTRKSVSRIRQRGKDPETGTEVVALRRKPYRIVYTFGGETFTKTPDAEDLAELARIEALPLPKGFPAELIPHMHMTHERANLASLGVTHVHHFFLPRARHGLAALWEKASKEPDARLRAMLLFTVEQAIWGMSILARYVPTHYSQVNQYLTGVYYVSSQLSECTPRYILSGKIERIVEAFKKAPTSTGGVLTTTGTCAALPVPDASIDYIFTDPPFGENIYYADLNFLVESFHRVLTDAKPEAIIDKAKRKSLLDYQELMTAAFREYFRVLKPGRWITVEFHNQHNHVWHAIQEAMTAAGFIVAAVRTFDKTQRSYRQVTSETVKLDLLVTAYRPLEQTENERKLRPSDPDLLWESVTEHLRMVPVVQPGPGGVLEVIEERTAHKLFDQMVSLYVSRSEQVPLSLHAFREQLGLRYRLTDGMYFLPAQEVAYLQRKQRAGAVQQQSLVPTDEASTIEWLRRELNARPQKLSDLTATFMKSSTGWRKHERPVELVNVLRENFVQYTDGPIPTAIWGWMGKSATLRKEMESATADAPTPKLVEAAKDLWYVPNPDNERELAALRRARLLREFEDYLSGAKKLKQFRTEALRAGFEQAWKEKSFKTIVAVGERIPPEVLAEDPRLLKLYNMSCMKTEG